MNDLDSSYYCLGAETSCSLSNDTFYSVDNYITRGICQFDQLWEFHNVIHFTGKTTHLPIVSGLNYSRFGGLCSVK